MSWIFPVKAEKGHWNEVEKAGLWFRERLSVPAITLEEAKLILLAPFETGTITARDKREKPDTILAVQGGFRQRNLSSRSHEDKTSFLLAHKNERFFIVDPGHCCDPLNALHSSGRTDSHNTWSFQAEPDQEGGEGKVILQQQATEISHHSQKYSNRNRMVQQVGQLHVIRVDSADAYGDPIMKAERTWIAFMPHVLFIVDRVESRTPVKVQSHFLLNNRDNRLKVNVAAANRLVFRRNEAALKFILLDARSGEQDNPYRLRRDRCCKHDCGQPPTNHEGQDMAGDAPIFRYETEHYFPSHTMIYAIAMDEEPLIRGWHLNVLEDGSCFVEPPGKAGGFALQLDKEEWLLHNRGSGETYRIAANHVEKLQAPPVTPSDRTD
ncbi:heparinase II/III domain-containing protein [Paenibacillus cymbidii]|uniref:heparinase II/III domain-containing protein n=1 Tax=Paenibacillus cymbidii TaxID=1639034 RepID=UPI0010818E57|nr:heparinase II/III family protein [Paenibacillus cymbidii]